MGRYQFLRGARMNHATFVECSMTNFTLAIIVRTDFTQADLTGAIFVYIVKGYMLTFIHTRLTGVIFTGGFFKNGLNVFTDSTLVGTVWQRAKVSATFEYCDLTKIDMTDAETFFVKFIDSRLDNAILVNTNMQGISFDFSHLINADLTDARSFDARKLAKMTSIHSTILPNGSRVHDEPLLRNAEAQCNRTVEEDWTVEEGQIEVVDHPREPDNCIFILAANATSNAKMSQIVDLTNYVGLIDTRRAKLERNLLVNDRYSLPWCDWIELSLEPHIDERN